MIPGENQLYFGDSTGETFAIDNDTFTDDGVDIAVRIRTKNYYLSNPDKLDEIVRVFVYADTPQATTLSLSRDSGDYETFGSVQEKDYPQRFDVWKKCYHCSVGLDEISSYNISVKGFNIEYTPLKEII